MLLSQFLTCKVKAQQMLVIVTSYGSNSQNKMDIFSCIYFGPYLEYFPKRILLCKEELQNQRIVKHTAKMFSSTPIPVYNAICNPGKYLSFHIFVCVYKP